MRQRGCGERLLKWKGVCHVSALVSSVTFFSSCRRLNDQIRHLRGQRINLQSEGRRLALLTVAVEELQLVVRAVVCLFSCLLLGKRGQTHRHMQGMQLSTFGAQISMAEHQ